jgi:hypothetical protein
MQRIDEDQANPRRPGKEMGAPEYLKPAQVDALEAASRLTPEKLPFNYSNQVISFEINLPPQSVATVTIEFGGEKKG